MRKETARILKWSPLQLIVLSIILYTLGIIIRIYGLITIAAIMFLASIIPCIVNLSLKKIRDEKGSKAISISVLIIIILIAFLLFRQIPTPQVPNCTANEGICADTNKYSACHDKDTNLVIGPWPCDNENEICCINIE